MKQFRVNRVILGENLTILKDIPNNIFDLIYIDPPFYTQEHYGDFNDIWDSKKDYLNHMKKRLEEIHRVLKETGSFFFHIDHHAKYQIKLFLDDIFGEEMFRNEIIWKRYHSASKSLNGISNITDSIFYYTKSNTYTYNPIYLKKEETLKRFNKKERKTRRRFRTMPLVKSGETNKTLEFRNKTITLPKGKRFVWSQKRLDKELEKNPNCIYWSKNNIPRVKIYRDTYKGKEIDNLWTDINALNHQSEEFLGYATQKPITLLERIIKMASNEGDLVGDFYCGSGTTLAVAKRKRRKWFGCDKNPKAIKISKNRLKKTHQFRNILKYT